MNHEMPYGSRKLIQPEKNASQMKERTKLMTLFTDTRISRRPALTDLWSQVKRMIVVRQQRRALRKLDARALEDIGITRAEAEAEAARPLWDAPDTWRC
ncbi:DUF1127 domain-containing protein [Jhaorihella thermophila]